MKIAIVQPHLKWDDKRSNLLNITGLLKGLPADAELIILPEMFNTGFSVNSKDLAEPSFSDTWHWMCKVSEEKQAAICGSFIVKENDTFFNRFMFISEGDPPVYYDKRHLFSMGGEDKNFTPGSRRTIINYLDFAINPIICYDLRFPVWIRNRKDYDLLVCVANWPETRREVWKTLLRARAMENQCYVAGVNCIGSDNDGNTYAGESVILNPKGEVLESIPAFKEGIAVAELSLNDLNNFREKFPAWRDADNFEIC